MSRSFHWCGWGGQRLWLQPISFLLGFCCQGKAPPWILFIPWVLFCNCYRLFEIRTNSTAWTSVQNCQSVDYSEEEEDDELLQQLCKSWKKGNSFTTSSASEWPWKEPWWEKSTLSPSVIIRNETWSLRRNPPAGLKHTEKCAQTSSKVNVLVLFNINLKRIVGWTWKRNHICSVWKLSELQLE